MENFDGDRGAILRAVLYTAAHLLIANRYQNRDLKKASFYLSLFFFFIRTSKVTRDEVKDNKSVTANVSPVIYRNGNWEDHRSTQSKHIDGRLWFQDLL